MDLTLQNLVLVSAITAFILIFQYIFSNLRYFKKQGIPGPTPIPFFGTLWQIWGKNVHEVLLEDYKKYGKIFGTYIGSTPCLNIADPKMIRAITRDDYQHYLGRTERTVNSIKGSDNYDLALLIGPKWKTIRNLVSASLAPTHVKQSMPLMNEGAQKLVTRLKQLCESDGKLGIQVECQCWSMEVMSKLLFSQNVDVIGYPNHEFTKNAGQEVRSHIEGIFSTITYLKPNLANIFNCSSKQEVLGLEYFAKISQESFQDREKSTTTRKSTNKRSCSLVNLDKKLSKQNDGTSKRAEIDMLDNLMMNLKTRSWTDSKLSVEEERVKLTVAQITASYTSFHDVGTTISRVLHCLAMNPEIQEKARVEIMESVLKNNGVVNFNLIQMLPYLEQCINESMRLYPIDYRLVRSVNEDKRYDNVFLKAGTLVRIPTLVLNLDPEYYPNPEKFDPERFSRVEVGKRDPYIFLPFGDGPRDCPARRIVMTITKFCICHILQNFKFYPVQATIDPLQFTSGFPGAMTVLAEMWLGIETVNLVKSC